MPYNSQYSFVTSLDAYRPSSPDGDGWGAFLVDPPVAQFIGSFCGVNVDTDLAMIGGNSNLIGGEILFAAASTVYYVDTQFNCSHSSLQNVDEGGPNFFIFNVDEDDPLISGNRASIAASEGGSSISVDIPVRNGEFTWVQILD
jgi:hypothetical protein